MVNRRLPPASRNLNRFGYFSVTLRITNLSIGRHD
jgi:hypothetical protein